MSFFHGCADIAAAKKLHRALARKHHPDKGGDLRIMQQINAEYDQFCKRSERRSYANNTYASYDAKDAAEGWYYSDYGERVKKAYEKRQAEERRKQTDTQAVYAEAQKLVARAFDILRAASGSSEAARSVLRDMVETSVYWRTRY
jgi:curved DNA-binding protein CbpA